MKAGRFSSTTTPAAGPDVSGRVFLIRADAAIEVGGSDLVAGQGFVIDADTPTSIGTEYGTASSLAQFYFVGTATVQYLKQL